MTGSPGNEPAGDFSPTARLATYSIAATLLVCLLFELRQGAASAATFASAGASRRIALPLVYGLLGLVLLVGIREQRRLAGPLWLWFPLIAGVASLSFNVDTFLHQGLITNVVQGMLLLVGFTVIGLAGCTTGRWSEADRRVLIVVLVGSSVAAVLLPTPTLALHPFAALVVPALFVSVVMIFSGGRFPWAWAGAAVVMAGLGYSALRPAPGFPIQIAVIGQLAVGGGVLVLLVLPRFVRKTLVAGASLLVVCMLFTPTVQDFLTGHYEGDDVTLAHRAYEAQQVERGVTASRAGLVVGLGPAATVDLTRSPDRATLLASGRDLARVDDVHLLTSYLLLKLGFVGIAWLVWLLVVVFRITWSVLCAARVDRWQACLLIFVLGGLVGAFPAGTELFSNPLVPLLLGILWAEGAAPRPRKEPVGSTPALTRAA